MEAGKEWATARHQAETTVPKWRTQDTRTIPAQPSPSTREKNNNPDKYAHGLHDFQQRILQAAHRGSRRNIHWESRQGSLQQGLQLDHLPSVGPNQEIRYHSLGHRIVSNHHHRELENLQVCMPNGRSPAYRCTHGGQSCSRTHAEQKLGTAPRDHVTIDSHRPALPTRDRRRRR